MNNKDKITEAAFSLSLKYGFDNVSIAQIKEEAKVTTGAIYYHFEDKDDILVEIIRIYLVEHIENFINIVNNVERPIDEKLRFIFYYIIGYETGEEKINNKIYESLPFDYKQYTLLVKGIYHQHPEVRAQFQDINIDLFNLYKKIIDDAIAKNEIRNDVNSEDAGLAIFTAIFGFADIWLGLPKYDIDQIIDANVDMICESIKK